jgi:hypothetical protein
MLGRNDSESVEPLGGRLGAVCTAKRATSPGTERGTDEGSGEHEGQWQTVRGEKASNGQTLSDLPALKPYRGKPAARNFREDNGNVGIIRSPLRAIALPDQSSEFTSTVVSSQNLTDCTAMIAPQQLTRIFLSVRQ